MKKQIKKITLNRETLRILDGRDFKALVGAATGPIVCAPTGPVPCGPSGFNTCQSWDPTCHSVLC